jgi:hypothetical protein
MNGTNGTKAPATLHDHVVEVQLTCSFSWGTVTDVVISDEVNSNKQSGNALKVRKTLMPKASGARVKALQTILSEFYGWHTQNTLSTPTKGRRLLPVPFHFLYMEKFGDAKGKADDALADLIGNFDADVQLARNELQGAFKADDYPTADEIDKYYNMDVKFFELPTSDRLLRLLGEKVAADNDAYVESMAKVATEDAKAKLRDVVAKMAERLAKPDNIFRDTLTQNLDDMLGILPMMNLTRDAEFDAIMLDAKQTLQGWDPNKLRKDMVARSQVAKAASDILARL